MVVADNLKKLGTAVAQFAPALGTAIAGPGGAFLGTIVAKAFGGDEQDPDEVIKKIQLDPESAIKLREIELNNKVQLEQLKVQSISRNLQNKEALSTLQVEDTKDARRHQEAVSDKWSRIIDELVKVMVVLSSVGLAVFCVIGMLHNDFTSLEASIAGIVLGRSFGIQDRVMSYSYGNNFTSKYNDDRFEKYANKS